MPYAVQEAREVKEYTARWDALISCVQSGMPYGDELKRIIDARLAESKPKPGKGDRLSQIQEEVRGIVERYSEILGKITVWVAELQEHMRICGAQLDGVPLIGSVSAVHEAFARASRNRMPEKPEIKLDDPASLEARAKYLRDVEVVVAEAERYPQMIMASIRALLSAMEQGAQELDVAHGRGQKSNGSVWRHHAPIHPFLGQPAPRPRPQPRVDPYEALFR